MSSNQGNKAQSLGFGKDGIRGGTTASHMMGVNQGNVPKGGVVSSYQSAGAKGGSGPTGGRVGGSLGFHQGGIQKNSTASHMMSVNQGKVPSGGVVASKQSAGAKGGKK